MAPVNDVAIVVRDLRKRFARVEAVRGVTFDVRAGTTTALLGGNGAGKTTTLSMLLGVLLPTSGAITVLGCDMLRDRHRVLAGQLQGDGRADAGAAAGDDHDLVAQVKIHGPMLPQPRKMWRSIEAGFISIE